MGLLFPLLIFSLGIYIKVSPFFSFFLCIKFCQSEAMVYGCGCDCVSQMFGNAVQPSLNFIVSHGVSEFLGRGAVCAVEGVDPEPGGGPGGS